MAQTEGGISFSFLLLQLYKKGWFRLKLFSLVYVLHSLMTTETHCPCNLRQEYHFLLFKIHYTGLYLGEKENPAKSSQLKTIYKPFS